MILIYLNFQTQRS